MFNYRSLWRTLSGELTKCDQEWNALIRFSRIVMHENVRGCSLPPAWVAEQNRSIYLSCKIPKADFS